ncbi:isochorismatase family protein [Grosmannia clavigera kw1407]|uniref:Isochorismatase family protein n=1 Tax=Grosmannia clavigera (strain kw1407 / UAMH 11150) TaxID=655863 RepID=F0XB37_GROCL|nr:isochorismatase family protein [Grosmannia clavigera kw1407]EFX05007.1 isochorismatase family protein [Grosmannia clavigera kw1407]
METKVFSSSIAAKPYSWPHDASFGPEKTALVVIDMQVDFCAPGGYMDSQGYSIEPARAVIPRIQALLAGFRTAGFPIYHTREGHRPDLSTLSSRELLRSRNNESGLGIGDMGPMGRLLVRGERGHEIVPELQPLADEPVVDKPGRSAMQYTDLKLLLDNRGVRNLVLCGVTTDVCVTTTMRDANDMGMDCVIVSDACAAGREDLHDAALASICEEGGIFGAVTTTADLLTALRG